MSEKILDSESQQKLTKAYMNLYDILVSEYQSQHITLGESRHNALHAIYKILDLTRKKNSGLEIDYLFELYTTQNQKMKYSSKRKIVDIQNTPRIKHAIVKLNEALDSCQTVETLVTLKQIYTVPKTFDVWANKLPDKDIQDLENNPRGFEKFYRKYVYQRKQK